ncbi:MAG: hypothetical protein EOM22_14960 [Gammaproteobacteria bacterium]|nr:hypothetical protein [Gammaproteobacteria bacterium]
MTQAHPSPAARHLVLVGLVGLMLPGLAAAAPPATEPVIQTDADPTGGASRLQALEQRVDALTRRLQQLESGASSGTSVSAPSKAGDINWSFDAALSRDPFNVTHQSFDRGSGRCDVLLKVVAPIPDPTPWQVPSGAPVPVVARIGLADGTASESLVFHLARGPRLEPGAILHLEAHVPPDQAAAISGLTLGIRRE